MPRSVARSNKVVIEAVEPCIDCGRHPAKRLVDDVVDVSADIYKDGHELIGARVRHRAPGGEWRHSPLRHDDDADRWRGSFAVDRIGRWQYVVEAWPDPLATWRRDLRKRVEAGQDVASELLEGADLHRRPARALRGADRKRVIAAAETMADAKAEMPRRLAAAFDEDVARLLEGPLAPDDVTTYEPTLELVVDRERAGFASWYETFPRSATDDASRPGTFASAAHDLERIAGMGFDVVYLPPIHPIGRTHRKGRNNSRIAVPADVGSPWAIGAAEGGHDAVHPDLGTLDDFQRYVEAARDLGMEVALDFALQCSPDHPWVTEHPEWFYARPDGTIRHAENPPKKYEDIYPLNFWCDDREALWHACRDLLLFWAERGVRTFRVDNPHTKPLAFWEWVIGDVHERHPDVVFLAEAFTRPKRMKGLAKLGFTQSYTYFTWKNGSSELREYLLELTQTPMREYYRPNFFANTPDILHEYLQTGGRPAFRVRLLLAATLSPVYGIYSGFELGENRPVRHGSEEYVDSEKYEIRPRDWSAPGNVVDEVARINRIRRENPALQRLANLRFLASDNDTILAYWKSAPGNDLIVCANTNPFHAQVTMVNLPLAEMGLDDRPFTVEDLLTGEKWEWRGARNYVALDPAHRVGHVLRIVRSPGTPT